MWYSGQSSVVWDGPMHYRIHSIPDPHPLNARNTPTIIVTNKNISTNFQNFSSEGAPLFLLNHYSGRIIEKSILHRIIEKSIGKTTLKKMFQKQKETLLSIILKTVTCQFYPLPNILSVTYIFWCCVNRMTKQIW